MDTTKLKLVKNSSDAELDELYTAVESLLQRFKMSGIVAALFEKATEPTDIQIILPSFAKVVDISEK